jgi:hypothetical protein
VRRIFCGSASGDRCEPSSAGNTSEPGACSSWCLRTGSSGAAIGIKSAWPPFVVSRAFERANRSRRDPVRLPRPTEGAKSGIREYGLEVTFARKGEIASGRRTSNKGNSEAVPAGKPREDVQRLEVAPERRSIVIAIALSAANHVSAYGSSQFPRDKAMKAEMANDYVRSWRDLFNAYLDYSVCDSGSIAEGFSDRWGGCFPRLRSVGASSHRTRIATIGPVVFPHAPTSYSEKLTG